MSFWNKPTRAATPFDDVQAATRKHRATHGCLAYTFEDGAALIELVRKQQPKRILELGTALGFTACCLAHGSPAAQVDTLEGDEVHATLARDNIKRHVLADRITVHQGQFEALLPRLPAGYDFVFFDGYAPPVQIILRIHELLIEKGLLVCSNTQLAHGAAAQALKTELNNAQHWQSLPAIEQGQTLLRLKVLSPVMQA